jgi:hypothetical protein
MNKKGAVKLNVGRSADRPASMRFFVVRLIKIYTFVSGKLAITALVC